VGLHTEEHASEIDLLSDKELKTAKAFHFEKHRRRYVVAHLALRRILGYYLQINPAAVEFKYNPWNKPFIANQSLENYYFSLTHSSEIALIAVTTGRPLGIDIERVRPIKGLLGVASRYFSAREQEALMTLHAEARMHGFYSCWTRKEAFIKAIGEGLSFRLESFSVSLLPDETAALLEIEGNPDEARRWTMEAITPAEGYVGAITIKAGRRAISCWQWMGKDFTKYTKCST
jgi:4'-phosphopantetheinyl transferase